MFSNLDTNGLILISIGLVIRFWVGRRRFRRRNIAGIEVFSSYLTAVAIRFLERFFNLFGFLLIVFGVITVLMRL
ncbi:hypothetical protein PBAL39_04453 [Pedobacter sp. BAL39]|nr:hypothetical protein PBAL39_04453 [Pedobacter sp. BAL39]